jgi:hypothetical protein
MLKQTGFQCQMKMIKGQKHVKMTKNKNKTTTQSACYNDTKVVEINQLKIM